MGWAVACAKRDGAMLGALREGLGSASILQPNRTTRCPAGGGHDRQPSVPVNFLIAPLIAWKGKQEKKSI
jgi:hypothetical protein